MRLDFVVMKLYRSNVEASKLMTRMIVVRAAIGASLSQPKAPAATAIQIVIHFAHLFSNVHIVQTRKYENQFVITQQ